MTMLSRKLRSVIPVTNVDKAIDVIDQNFKPISDFDQNVADDCESHIPNKEVSEADPEP